jgi:hypothetical protein
MTTGRGLPFGPLHDRLLRQAYTNHRSNHIKIEEYLDTSLFRLDCARLCVDGSKSVLPDPRVCSRSDVSRRASLCGDCTMNLSARNSSSATHLGAWHVLPDQSTVIRVVSGGG